MVCVEKGGLSDLCPTLSTKLQPPLSVRPSAPVDIARKKNVKHASRSGRKYKDLLVSMLRLIQLLLMFPSGTFAEMSIYLF